MQEDPKAHSPIPPDNSTNKLKKNNSLYFPRASTSQLQISPPAVRSFNSPVALHQPNGIVDNPDSAKNQKTSKALSQESFQHSIQFFQEKLRPTETHSVESHLQRLRTAHLSERDGGPSKEQSSFKSHSPARKDIAVPSYCASDFYIDHNSTSVEQDSRHSRMSSMALPLTRTTRDSTSSQRTILSVTDSNYDSTRAFDATCSRSICTTNLDRAPLRNTSNSILQPTSAPDASYDPNDRFLSKRQHSYSASLSHCLGTPARSVRLNPPVTYSNTLTEERINYNKAEEVTHHRDTQALSFGRSKTPLYITGQSRGLHRVHPSATLDEFGNPLPAVYYDVNINATHPRTPSPVSFAHQLNRPGYPRPITSDLDYSPDTTAGIAYNGQNVASQDNQLLSSTQSRLNTAGSLSIHSSMNSYPNNNTRSATAKSTTRAHTASSSTSRRASSSLTSHPNVAPSLVTQYERTQTTTNQVLPLLNSSNSIKISNNSLRSSFAAASANNSGTMNEDTSNNSSLPLSLTASSLFNPPNTDFTLVSAGVRSHTMSTSFDSYITREQADPTRNYDPPVDRFYHTEQAFRFIYPNNNSALSSAASFRHSLSHDHPIISHVSNQPTITDLNYNPSDKSVSPKTYATRFSQSNPPNVFSARNLENSTSNVPFYNTDIAPIRPNPKIVTIAPVPGYGV